MRCTTGVLLVAVGTIGALRATAATDEPGLLVRLYDVGEEMQALPELAPGQAPNVVKVVSRLDLHVERGDFEPLKELFLTEILGQLEIPRSAGVTLRLISDDGARLWLDGRVVIDHDGTHGATPKDARVELPAGRHELRIMHFQGRGGGQLSLHWEPTGTTLDGIVPVPATVLSHKADTPRETAPGKKKIIAALRRGRPGDGSQLTSPHPSFVEKPQAVVLPAVGYTIAGGFVRNRNQATPLVYVPDVEADAKATVSVINHETYGGQFLIAGVPESRRVFVERVGDEMQGCALRFGQNCGPALTASDQPTFELLSVEARRNGLEIRFTKPLDTRIGWDPETYYVEQWPFRAEATKRRSAEATQDDVRDVATPARDGVVYPVKSASVSDDRRKVFLEITSLKPSHVVYLRLLPPCISEDGELPWSTEAWYTLNALPQSERGEVRTPPPPEPQNVLTDEEQAAGWRLLFDGQTTAGWRGYKKDGFPDDGWKVIHGCLVRVGRGGDICTVDEFDNFELRLEWRISAAGNSGVFYRVDEQLGWPWESGPEMQVLDNTEHADGQNPRTSAGSCYAIYAPARDVTQPVGLFNQVRIVARGRHIEHWLNDAKVVEYELESPAWEALLAESKFKTMPRHGRVPRGHIVLQDHGDRVWYRNIKIRMLTHE